MVSVYVVRDPLHRVIGLSIASYMGALDDADLMGDLPRTAYQQLPQAFENNQEAEYRGYTLKKEILAT